MINTPQSKLEISVGLSRKWDAKEAGREVARNTIKKLNQPPSFILLFSTIHYKKNGGFQKLLDGIWEVLPKKTPLIGGTVACFINNYGCFARGVTALAVSYPNADIAVGIGKYTKIHPKDAASQCANMIKKGLKNSKFSNKFLINVISGPETPVIPGLGRINYVDNRFIGFISTYLGMKIFPLFGDGPGKETDVIEQIASDVPDFKIIGGSSVDKGEILRNYQFIQDEVHTNSVVALGCCIDLPVHLNGIIGLRKTDKKFKITGTAANGRIITKINDKPARKQIYELLDFPEDKVKNIEHFYYTASDYFPITFEGNNETVIGMGPFLGNNIVMGHRVGGVNAQFLTISGREIMDNIDKIFQLYPKDYFPFIFSFSSSIYPFMLGRRTFDIKSLLDEKIGNRPYLMVNPMVENIYFPGKKPSVRVYSTNIFSFEEN